MFVERLIIFIARGEGRGAYSKIVAFEGGLIELLRYAQWSHVAPGINAPAWLKNSMRPGKAKQKTRQTEAAATDQQSSVRMAKQALQARGRQERVGHSTW